MNKLDVRQSPLFKHVDLQTAGIGRNLNLTLEPIPGIVDARRHSLWIRTDRTSWCTRSGCWWCGNYFQILSGHLHEIKQADDPETMLEEKVAAYREEFMNPYKAAARGFIDAVILPEESRAKIARGLDMLSQKVDNLPRKKHGNIPL